MSMIPIRVGSESIEKFLRTTPLNKLEQIGLKENLGVQDAILNYENLPLNQITILINSSGNTLPYLDQYNNRPRFKVGDSNNYSLLEYDGSEWVYKNVLNSVDNFRAVLNSTIILPWEEPSDWVIQLGSGNITFTVDQAMSSKVLIRIFDSGRLYSYDGQFKEVKGSVESLSASNITTTGIMSASTVIANSVVSNRPQTTYEGSKNTFSINNPGLTANQARLGRMTMLDIINNPNAVLNLIETSTNKFVEGDVVGIWARFNNAIAIRYTPLNQSPIHITTYTGGYAYNTGSISLVYKNNTFVIQTPNDQNLKGIMSELKVESIQPNDPGTPFSVIGRGLFVHGLTLNAGDAKFTDGSDHFHLIQSGAGGSFQTLNAGFNYTSSRISQHTTPPRGLEFTTQIVAAYAASLTANQTAPPYSVTPVISSNYLSLWVNTSDPRMVLNKIVYFSVSPTGSDSISMRKIGFTAASYPAKIIYVGNTGTTESNADIPTGYTLPNTAVKHLRIQPLNLSPDNWLGAAQLPNNILRGSNLTPFNTITNSSEVLRIPDGLLMAPDFQQTSLSSTGGYNTVSMRNGCELVFDLTTNPLLSSQLPFLYEGLPVLVSNAEILSAISYNGLTPNSLKSEYGPLRYSNGEFVDNSVSNYINSSYDGYIYKSTPTQVVIRLGILGGNAESRLQTFESPNVEYFLNRPSIFTNPSNFTKTLPPGGLSAVELNGYQITGMTSAGPRDRTVGFWYNGSYHYTMPKIMKGGIEFASFPPISSTNFQLAVYAGNKDPVHRPVASLQLFSYDRYPSVQPELRETSGIVSRFAIGPSCEGFNRESAAIGFASTAYHRKSMAIGHKVETLSTNEIAIGVDSSALRVTLNHIGVSTNLLSSNGVDTMLKIRSDDGVLYGLKLQKI